VRINDVVFIGLTTAQLISVAMIVAGIAWIVTVRQRYGTLARPADQQAVRAV
jgi:prolipoprotein diacylglyceryltransferase